MTYMEIIASSFKFSGTDSEECNAVAMFRIHVGMYLKYKTRKLIFFRLHHPHRCLPGNGRRSDPNECVQQFLYTKVVHGASKKYRRDFSVEVMLDIKIRINTLDKFNVSAQLP